MSDTVDMSSLRCEVCDSSCTSGSFSAIHDTSNCGFLPATRSSSNMADAASRYWFISMTSPLMIDAISLPGLSETHAQSRPLVECIPAIASSVVLLTFRLVCGITQLATSPLARFPSESVTHIPTSSSSPSHGAIAVVSTSTHSKPTSCMSICPFRIA